jgi:hypothetical protein
MRHAAGLAVLAAGAILTFAVSARVPGINLRVAGVIIMIAGAAGMVTPEQAAAWLRGGLTARGGRAGPDPGDDDDYAHPAYLLQDPAVLAAEVLRNAGTGQQGLGYGPDQPPAGGTQRDDLSGRRRPA